MVNPLSRKNMSRFLSDSDRKEYQEYSAVTNLDQNQNTIIKKIISGDGIVTTASLKTLTLDEVVQKIKDRR